MTNKQKDSAFSDPGPSYIWPSTLRLPSRPPLVVYLDLNHWIGLSKAMSGHSDAGPYREALDCCIQAKGSGTAVFPVSIATYIECSKIGPYDQRRKLRDVIEQISRYQVVLPRNIILAHEVEALLDAFINPNPHPINTIDYLDWGVFRACGLVGGLRVISEDGTDITDEYRSSFSGGPDRFDSMAFESDVTLNRLVLEGPTPEKEPKLRELGWNPTSAYDVARKRAQQEKNLVAELDKDPHWRRGRLRDVIAARELCAELIEYLNDGLSRRGAQLADLFPDSVSATQIIDRLPSFTVAVGLKASIHKNSTHDWTANDILDIDAISSTLPYCDIVAIDKSMASHCSRNKLAEHFGSSVVSNVSDLVDLLQKSEIVE